MGIGKGNIKSLFIIRITQNYLSMHSYKNWKDPLLPIANIIYSNLNHFGSISMTDIINGSHRNKQKDKIESNYCKNGV